jgi:diacylglycerol O-acyltransferase / wax synthase
MGEQDSSAERAETMSGSDALLWTISSDPVMRPTIVAILLLDGTPDWAEVRARVAGLSESVPRLRSRVVTRAPGRGRPQFVVDDSFHLDTHLRRIRLPEHGGLRDVLDMAQTMATSGFDAALPLWEAVLVEGVDAKRAALVLKVHHALIDGVGGLAVLAQLFDSPAPIRRPVTGGAVAPEHAAATGRVAGDARHRPTGDLPDAVRLVDGAVDALTHPFRTLGQVAAVGTSVARLMAPAGKPISPIMTGRSFRRHVEIIDLDLGDLKRAATAWGGTVNDVFVASVVRGLTLYHEQHGVVTSGFRALMPVNVRSGAAGESGNHFVPARFVIAARTDLAGCMAEVQRNAEEWKHAPGLAMSEVLATGLSALPPVVARNLWSSMLLGNDFCITNIPGPPFRAFLAGAAIDGIYAVSPPSGAALNVSLISAADRACITLTADVAAVPDSPKLAGCIEDGFAEVCSVREPGPPAP